jgi:hypothetical protein
VRYGKRKRCQRCDRGALMDALAEIIVLLALLLGSIGKKK